MNFQGAVSHNGEWRALSSGHSYTDSRARERRRQNLVYFRRSKTLSQAPGNWKLSGQFRGEFRWHPLGESCSRLFLRSIKWIPGSSRWWDFFVEDFSERTTCHSCYTTSGAGELRFIWRLFDHIDSILGWQLSKMSWAKCAHIRFVRRFQSCAH